MALCTCSTAGSLASSGLAGRHLFCIHVNMSSVVPVQCKRESPLPKVWQGGCTCRRDGHNWRKKADGKTIRETHEKLKVRWMLLKCHSCMSMLDWYPTLVSDVFAADSIPPFKPQVGNKEALNCYYAHADQEDQLQVLLLACLCVGPSVHLGPAVHLGSFAWCSAI